MANQQGLSGFPVDRLKERKNYPTWKITMEAYLDYEDLWGCVQGKEEYTKDARKDSKVRSQILLAVDPINYVHIQGTIKAKEA